MILIEKGAYKRRGRLLEGAANRGGVYGNKYIFTLLRLYNNQQQFHINNDKEAL
jgi:hypothetical protein